MATKPYSLATCRKNHRLAGVIVAARSVSRKVSVLVVTQHTSRGSVAEIAIGIHQARKPGRV